MIVPIYQAENTLRRCIDSVLKQSMGKFELILIDDGSTDNSREICNEYALKDKRIKVVHQHNQGVSAARNYGISISCGQYLLFLDSDDCLAENLLERYMQCMEENAADVVIGAVNWICSDGKHIKRSSLQGKFGKEIWNEICIDSDFFGRIVGKMLRADLVRENRLHFNTAMKSQEDLDFYLKFYQYCKKFYLTEYAGYFYYYSPSSRYPIIWDYIRNQVKMMEYAGKNIEISATAEKTVLDRIGILIFSGLYTAHTWSEFRLVAKKMESVKNLQSYLKKIPVRNEQGIVVSLFMHQRYKTLYLYFRVRSMIKRVILGRH